MARRLEDSAPPGSQVLLFGSYARGTAGPDSDVDFLVVEPSVANRHAEMVRLRRALRGVPVGVDILVIGREAFKDWSRLPGSIYHEIQQEGKLLSHAA